jgi:hypothetical protein
MTVTRRSSVTAQSKDQDQVDDPADDLHAAQVDDIGGDAAAVEPSVEASARTSVLDLDAMDDLTVEEAARLAATAGRTRQAFTAETSERLGEIVQRVVAPQLGEAAKRMSDIVAGYELTKANSVLASALAGFESSDVFKSFLDSNALARSAVMNGVIEALGRSSADRAAFSIASGLKMSDSLTSTIGKLMADTDGIGIARKALAASVGESLKGLDIGLNTKSQLGALAKDLRPKIDLTGFESVINKSTFANLEGIRSVLDNFAGADLARTRSLAMQQLIATSGIADFIGSDRMVASWRQSLLSEATARSLIGTMALPETGATLLRDIVGANAATARVVGRYAELNKANILAPAVSARPTRELRAYLAGMSVAPELGDLTFAVRASRSVAGIAAADLIVADGTIEDEAGELFEAEIVEPWLTGPEASRDLLFSRLGALDPQVPDLLRGAWTQVEQNGPATTSMASHAVQEAIDRTLRALAPAELVLRLFVAGHLPKNSVHEQGGERHPTRAGRIAAALHERHPGETKLIAAQAKALAASVTFLTDNLQGGKHASKGNVGLVRTWLVSVEATFTQLLYEPGDS